MNPKYWKIGHHVWYVDSVEQVVFGVIVAVNKKYAIVKSEYGDNDVDFECLNYVKNESTLTEEKPMFVIRAGRSKRYVKRFKEGKQWVVTTAQIEKALQFETEKEAEYWIVQHADREQGLSSKTCKILSYTNSGE